MLYKRLHFTLIEIMMVLILLSLFAGVIGMNLIKALREQRFRTETALILEKLRLAQDLMLILGEDVHVIFLEIIRGPDDKEISYWIESEKLNTQTSQTLHRWNEELTRKPKNLTTIKSIEFKDQLSYPTTPGRLDLKFLSGGAIMSKGVMRLTSSSRADTPALEEYIHLSGYPHPITSKFFPVNYNQDQKQEDHCTQQLREFDDLRREESEINDRMTKYTVEELLKH